VTWNKTNRRTSTNLGLQPEHKTQAYQCSTQN